MAKTKKDTNARVAGRKKQAKERAAEQLSMDNMPMDLNEYDDSSVSDTKGPVSWREGAPANRATRLEGLTYVQLN